MASESSGSKNQPYFASSGAPAIDVDPGIVSDYAAKVGNRRVGTTAERTAATGKDVWDGLEWADTTDGRVYLRVAGAWQMAWRVPVAVATAFATATGYTMSSALSDLYVIGGFLSGVLTVTKNAGVIAHADVLCTVRAGYRPPCPSNGQFPVAGNISSGDPARGSGFAVEQTTGYALKAFTPAGSDSVANLAICWPIVG